MTAHSISFGEARFPAITIAEGSALAEHLTIENSPVLFGCRTAICGTCVIRLFVLRGYVPPPTAEERETLAMVAADDPCARLACQLRVTADVRIDRMTS